MAKFKGWQAVNEILTQKISNADEMLLSQGQKFSLTKLMANLPNNGMIIADEVGMGKTRIACVLAKAVIQAKGRVAVVAPTSLGDQWQEEFKKIDVSSPNMVRSIYQYLEAWADGDNLAPWFDQSLVMVSHGFANWRFNNNSVAWRWALLPCVYALWRKDHTGRFPNGYHDNFNLDDEWVINASQSIFHHAKTRINKLFASTDENRVEWKHLFDPSEYAKHGELRDELETLIGIGFGEFDLLIIDEAHKSRGQESSLNSLVESIILSSKHSRRLALTATPVELDSSQWQAIFQRISLPQAQVEKLSKIIESYSQAVSQVQAMPTNESAVTNFIAQAKQFETALTPYLSRRDKRQLASIQNFVAKTGLEHHQYREHLPFSISTEDLDLAWKQAICAAEALSFVANYQANTFAKRLRLTIGNGHGITSLLDSTLADDTDKAQLEQDKLEYHVETISLKNNDKKQAQRLEFWQNVLIKNLNHETSLYQHPAISIAIKQIEKIIELEKVLVFGRFTKPMQALVDMLNARAMLQALDKSVLWAQAKIQVEKEAVLLTAFSQLLAEGKLTSDLQALASVPDKEKLNKINDKLEKQYQQLENQRRNLRNQIDKYIQEIANDDNDSVASAIVQYLKADTQSNMTALLARALQEKGMIEAELNANDFLKYFKELVNIFIQVKDDEESYYNESVLYEEFKTALTQEYDNPEGKLARLMNGTTEHNTRRHLRYTFNNANIFPKVLVCQSLVGREGLNLHEACRTVILLHAEWNPGVVEQQIGRVDRLGSLWERQLKDYLQAKSPMSIPKINIHPIIFKGTYDEYNWQVLEERWDDLRAQLHGVILPPKIAKNYEKYIVININQHAPNFQP